MFSYVVVEQAGTGGDGAAFYRSDLQASSIEASTRNLFQIANGSCCDNCRSLVGVIPVKLVLVGVHALQCDQKDLLGKFSSDKVPKGKQQRLNSAKLTILASFTLTEITTMAVNQAAWIPPNVGQLRQLN